MLVFTRTSLKVLNLTYHPSLVLRFVQLPEHLELSLLNRVESRFVKMAKVQKLQCIAAWTGDSHTHAGQLNNYTFVLDWHSQQGMYLSSFTPLAQGSSQCLALAHSFP